MSSEATFLRPHLIELGASEEVVDALERAWSNQGGSYIDMLAAEGLYSLSTAQTLKMAVKGYVLTPVPQIIGRIEVPETDLLAEPAPVDVPAPPSAEEREDPLQLPPFPPPEELGSLRSPKSWAEVVDGASTKTRPAERGVGSRGAAPEPVQAPPRASATAPVPPSLSTPSTRRSSPSPATGRRRTLPRVGDRLGRYVVQERLGEGSTAIVFRSFHDALGVPVAVKVFRPEAMEQVDFLSEARTLAKLDHANIVRVLDVEEDPVPFIVFEYVGAMTLEDLVKASGRLPLDRVLELGIELASGLQAAWQQSLLHRDVKPTNVLLRRDGRAKLVDFGLAVVRQSLGGLSADQACGSPAFMAPEQILRPGEVDHRADMYGLGATLYNAAYGQPPLIKSTPAETLRAQLHDEPIPLNERIEAFDAQSSKLIQKLLQKKPKDRFDDWDEVIELFVTLRSRSARSREETDRSAKKTLRRTLSSIWTRKVGT